MLNQLEFIQKLNSDGSVNSDSVGKLKHSHEWHRSLIFDSISFTDEVDFSRSVFSDIKFINCQFDKQLDFSSCTFKRTVLFSECTFKDSIILRKSRFDDSISLCLNNFLGDIVLSNQRFPKKVTIEKCEFHKNVVFDETAFLDEISCIESTFHGNTSFSRCQFRGCADFTNSQFHSIVNFRFSNFYNKVDFIGRIPLRIFPSPSVVLMNNVQFHEPNKVCFKTANLSNCSLVNTDIAEIELTDIHWAKRYGRRVVYDEISQEPDTNFAYVELLYRQLKKNYESIGAYGEGSDFHYGEMEMRRLSQQRFFRLFSLLNVYRFFSGYGERYWRSLGLLFIFLILVFPFGYLLCGIALPASHVSATLNESHIIKYAPSFQPWIFATQQFWDDYTSSLLHTLQISTFQKDHTFIPCSNYGRFLELIQLPLISLQAALSVLAINRKYKR